MRNQIPTITSVIRTVRGQKVLLDEDLARIYGVPTKALNQANKRPAFVDATLAACHRGLEFLLKEQAKTTSLKKIY